MSLLSILAIILAIWGVITLVRRIAEAEQRRVERGAVRGDAQAYGRTDARGHGRTGAPAYRRAEDDEIDYDELRRAEEEVRDLDVNARPEDGFEGDDWGPGASRKPPLV